MKIEFSPLAIIVALIILTAATLVVVRSCGESSNMVQRSYVETPKDMNFVAALHTPVSSAKQLKKAGAKIPAGVKSSTVNKVVQIKLKTGDTLQVAFTLGGGNSPETDVFVAKDSMIESVTVLDVKPPAFRLNLLPGAGATLRLASLAQGKLAFEPSMCISLFQINRYRFPVLAADFSGAGAGVGYEVLPKVEVAVSYWYEFNGTRGIKAGIYYEF